VREGVCVCDGVLVCGGEGHLCVVCVMCVYVCVHACTHLYVILCSSVGVCTCLHVHAHQTSSLTHCVCVRECKHVELVLGSLDHGDNGSRSGVCKTSHT